MCGIIAAISSENIIPLLVDGLRRLEYRGYDSSGLAVLVNGKIVRRRAVGKITELQQLIDSSPIDGTIGLGHTRWATHGAPSVPNTHPQATDTVAVVHNGIIENYLALKEELQQDGYVFESDTDTEVVPILLTHLVKMGHTHTEAVEIARRRLEGVYSLAIVFAGSEQQLFAVRCGVPMLIGQGKSSAFLCSDVAAVVHHARHFTVLEDGDFAVVRQDSFEIYDAANKLVERDGFTSGRMSPDVEKGRFGHYMLKEIHDQPDAVRRTLHAFLSAEKSRVRLPWVPFDPKRLTRISIVATGASRYAGQVAKYWIERLARIPVDVEIASEFSYRDPAFTESTLFLAISQSGETADTLRAVRLAKDHGQVIAAVVNVPESTLAREVDIIMPVLSGPEIGVVATKSFTGQLTTLALLAVYLARSRGEIGRSSEQLYCRELSMIPTSLEETLNIDAKVIQLAERLKNAEHLLLLGRGTLYPIARAGALMINSTSYIYSLAQSAGELKHGQIALIDEHMPVIVLAKSGRQLDKLISNVMEVRARGGDVTVFADANAAKAFSDDEALRVITLPGETHELSAPTLFALPLQLLAYHLAILRGADVDQPRNLAKSVTVE